MVNRLVVARFARSVVGALGGLVPLAPPLSADAVEVGAAGAIRPLEPPGFQVATGPR